MNFLQYFLKHNTFEARNPFFNRVSKITWEGGNDAESKVESKYVTLTIEENYLADGLAKQTLAAADAIEEIKKMPLRTFAKVSAIRIGRWSAIWRIMDNHEPSTPPARARRKNGEEFPDHLRFR